MGIKHIKTKEKVTVISTVLNEEDSVDRFIKSLLGQSRLPDEVVIVDGGSTDATVQKLKKHGFAFSDIGVDFTLVQRTSNRSVARNIAIRKAQHNILAVSDAGCILHRDWLKNLMVHFEKTGKPDVVSGFYSADYDDPTVFQVALSTYTCTMPDKVDPESFLPSSRSVAYTRSAWKSVGGYPEELDTCEDLVFAKRLKEYGCQFVFEKNAIVYWPQKQNIFQAGKQLYGYAFGDGQALYFRKQTPFLYGRYLAGIVLLFTWPTILLIAIPLYILWSIAKNYRYINNVRALYLLPLLQFTADITVMSGMLHGIYDRSIKHH